MNQSEINALAAVNRQKGLGVLAESGFVEIMTAAGWRVNLVGSLRMGLLASHRDIDLHVYSHAITTTTSFSGMGRIAADRRVTELKCINGLHTNERCIAWHVHFKAGDGEIWKFDIIHIESGTEYDGYFERMADRIVQVMTTQQRDTILRLKFATPPHLDYHGVEYYEAVISDGVTTFPAFEEWVTTHRKRPPYYWIP